jgi:hypothetical protein
MLKEGIDDPSLTSLDNMLDETDATTSARRSNAPTSHNKGQVGHNQTYGADVTRSGVPRRTAG